MNGLTTVVMGVRGKLDEAGAGIDREATLSRWEQALEAYLSWLVKSGVLVTLRDDDTAVAVTPGDLVEVVIVDRMGAALEAELERWEGWSVTVADSRPKKGKTPTMGMTAPVAPVVPVVTPDPVTESGNETPVGG